LRITTPELERDMTEVSLIQPNEDQAVPANRTETESMIPPKLLPDTKATALPVVEKLNSDATKVGFGGDISMSGMPKRRLPIMDTATEIGWTVDRDILRTMLLLPNQLEASKLVRSSPESSTLKFPLQRRAVGLDPLMPKPLPITLKKTPPLAGSSILVDSLTKRKSE
jgi:hypothetical protein